MSINLKNIEKNKIPVKRDIKGVFSFLDKDISWSKGKLSDIEKENFYNQLGILLDSGLDIKTSFQVMQNEKRSIRYSKFVTLSYKSLILGSSFSDSTWGSNYISLYEYYSMRIGEETGRLSTVLKQLSIYYKNRIQQRRNIVNMLSYPIILLITVIVVVVFMLNMIVPMFQDLFARFDSELPALTQFIIDLSEIVKTNLLLIIVVPLLFALSIYSLRNKIFFKKFISEFLLKIPIINQLILKTYLAKYCQLMSLLSASSIPLITSLQLIKKVIGFYPFEQAFDQIEKKIVDGALLYEAMSGYKIFDSKLISLTKVGEEVNQLQHIYSNLGTQYLAEVEFQMKKFNTIIEPVIIIVVGGFVAILLISMYLPMFKMSDSLF